MSDNKSIEGIIYNYFEETKPLMENIGSVRPEDLKEMYSLYKILAKVASEQITSIDPSLRVIICQHMEKILEYIVDANSFALKNHQGKRIFTPAVQGYRRWTNIELMKDKGLTGYLLAKEIEGRHTMMFCTKFYDYPYMSILKEQELLFTDDSIGDLNTYYTHLFQNYKKMDMLILHGMYNETMNYLNEYRKLRPDGIVYCGLDMNSYWMRNISWQKPEVRRFANQCDLIATSCRKIRDDLNLNPHVNFPCHWIPNGFYNPNNESINNYAKEKKNIILTVGRIGTQQKNNLEMILGFIKAYDRIPGWQLRLVGNIEENFKKQIEELFTSFPEFKERIIFTGPIVDKVKLYQEYAQAKIFALTSIYEGGTPNVYAEALFHGCMFLTSSIDAADDITSFGELGEKYQAGNLCELEETIVRLVQNSQGIRLEDHIKKSKKYAEKYFDWNRNIKKLAYMLDIED